ILVASRKLRHYFQAHTIRVVTSYPLERILRNREATGRVAKWAVELGAFDIQFVSAQAIKSQPLADFVAEWTSAPSEAVDADAGSLTRCRSIPVGDGRGSLSVGRAPGAPSPAGSPSGGQAADGHRVAAGLDTEVESWIQPIRAYLCGQAGPEDDATAEKVARQAKRYALVDGHLYRRGANGTLLKCITREEGS